MKSKLKLIGVSLAGSSLIAISAVGLVSADKNGKVGSSGVPRSVFKQERLEAASQVLNTSTSTIQSAHKHKTFKQLVSSAGLNGKTYHQKLKAQLTSDLEAKGYTQSQVTIALQHKEIVKLHHKFKELKS